MALRGVISAWYDGGDRGQLGVGYGFIERRVRVVQHMSVAGKLQPVWFVESYRFLRADIAPTFAAPGDIRDRAEVRFDVAGKHPDGKWAATNVQPIPEKGAEFEEPEHVCGLDAEVLNNNGATAPRPSTRVPDLGQGRREGLCTGGDTAAAQGAAAPDAAASRRSAADSGGRRPPAAQCGLGRPTRGSCRRRVSSKRTIGEDAMNVRLDGYIPKVRRMIEFVAEDMALLDEILED